jgi:transcriptional regulator with XRE-family HTH domain
MPGDHDRETLRRRLRQELKNYRTVAGLTQREVAEAMDWSPSKVNRIEAGIVTVSINDLRALLTLFGVTAETVNELVEVAKLSKRSSWGRGPAPDRAPEAAYFADEKAAVVIRQFEPALIPGLLQTEDYMRAVVADARMEEGARLERQVQTRLERQRVLDRPEAPKMFFIIDEAVLHHRVGSWQTMPQQRQRLLELGSRKNISIQIVPFSRGAYTGLLGPFVLLDLADRSSRLYLEAQDEILVRDDVEETGRYLDQFQLLEHKLATEPDHLGDAIASLT